jgi:hypothetical protein
MGISDHYGYHYGHTRISFTFTHTSSFQIIKGIRNNNKEAQQQIQEPI